MLYTVEPQVEMHIPLSVLLDDVGRPSEDGLYQLRQWVDERLSTLSAEVSTPKGKSGQALRACEIFLRGGEKELWGCHIEAGQVELGD